MSDTCATNNHHPHTNNHVNDIPSLESEADLSKLRVLIVGAGIIGLSNALYLTMAGAHVTIVAKQSVDDVKGSDEYASTAAGALWEYPPGVCGRHDDPVSLTRARDWSIDSYNIWWGIQKRWGAKATGVYFLPAIFFFKFRMEDIGREDELAKMHSLQSRTLGFYRPEKDQLQDYCKKHGVDTSSKYGQTVRDAYEWLSPHIDTDVFVRFLWNHLKSGKNFRFIKKAVGDGEIKKNFLKDHYYTLTKEYNVHCIINATGLGANKLVGDYRVYPLRGAIFRGLQTSLGQRQTESICMHISGEVDTRDYESMSVPDLKKEILTMFPEKIDLFQNNSKKELAHFLRSMYEGSLPMTQLPNKDVQSDIIFIVPRGENILLLGGLTQPHEWGLETNIDYPPFRNMEKNCKEFLPKLKDIKYDVEPLRCGLRPFRPGNIRLEKEETHSGQSDMLIIHTYGHGGAGFCLAWGCAREVRHLIFRHFKNSLQRAEKFVNSWPIADSESS